MGLLGSGSSGKSNNPKFTSGGGATKATAYNAHVNVDPSQSGNVDQVQERSNQAMKGKRLSDQLKKNKSGSSPLP